MLRWDFDCLLLECKECNPFYRIGINFLYQVHFFIYTSRRFWRSDGSHLASDGPAIVLASSLRDEKGDKVVDDEHENIVLLLLKEGQSVDFTCEIIRGSGSENVKFSKVVAPFIDRSGDLVFETISKQYSGEDIAREAFSLILSHKRDRSSGSV